MTLRKAFLFAAVVAVAGLMTVPAAHADAIYNFTYDGCSGGCGPQASFGTITLHQVDSNTVQLTVSLLNNNVFVTTGSHVGFGFNVSGSAVSLGALPSGWSNAGTNQGQPGFGSFSNAINCDTGNQNNKGGCAGSNPWVGDLIFDVTRGTGLSLSDFVVNGNGKVFTADILSGTTGNTGPIAADGTHNDGVPEPGTLAMLGTGVIGLATMLRRKFSV